MQRRTHSGEQLKSFAQEYVRTLSPRSYATVVALSGELGAGKTTFVQGVAAALGVQETVASPTFVIEKVYELSRQKWERLIHIDAYRLKSAHELEVLGWKEITEDPANLILLEWPERVEEAIPDEAIHIRIDIEGDGRIISIEHGKKDGEKN
ncbi:MAG: tRNA (adenosine(37)-N6)-threonylcarbamoyltransferase complex ATPase subunit type 1 TsaE [Patescibacteria group bacterium]